MASGQRRSRSVLASRVLALGVVTAVLLQVGVAAGGITALVNYQRFADDLVPPEALNVNEPAAGSRIVDRNGMVLYEYTDDQGVRLPVPLASISRDLIAATIATEDISFFSNPGINMRGLARATAENLDLVEGPSTGGSSITQQLVKNVYIPMEQRQERSFERKMREAVYALELTKRYGKAQILEWYLNQIGYGSVYAGAEAASWAFFGKPAAHLTLAEAALLAGIPQSPAVFNPVTNPEAAMERRNQVLDLLAEQEAIQIGPDEYYKPDPAAIAAARREPIEVHAPNFPVQAPHFVFSYIAPQVEMLVGRGALVSGGLTITTTLDIELQREAERLLDQWIAEFEEISNTHNGAVMVMEPRTGEILVMVGSRDYYREDLAGNVNNLFYGNSPGSTFKPFVYLTAFERLGWRPNTIIEDTPVSYREQDGSIFTPVNPNKGFNGRITLRNALGNSLNVPAFKAAQAVGPAAIVEFAKGIGFTGLDGYFGPAIAIGGVDLKPFDLTYGYATIANGGVLSGQDSFAPADMDERTIEPIGILKIEDAAGNVLFDVNQHRVEKRVIREEYAYQMSDILSDPSAQCITFGCGGLNIPGHRVAVKTGTSEPYDPKGPDAGKIGETWAFGFTPDYAVGVWAGNSDNQPIVNIYSTSISFRAMRDILLAAYDGRPSTPFPRPGGFVLP